MSLIKAAIDAAVGEVIAEHPKYFTPRGIEKARDTIVRKVMAALRDGGKSPDEPPAESAPPLFVLAALESREARGYSNFRQISGAVAPTRSGDGRIVIPALVNCDAVFAFADLPPKERWVFVTDNRPLTAWAEFFRDLMPNVPRRPINIQKDGVSGALLPWPWPPSKTGKIYDEAAA